MQRPGRDEWDEEVGHGCCVAYGSNECDKIDFEDGASRQV